MYALIEFAGKQFKVEKGKSLKVPYINGKVGSKVSIDKILYMSDGENNIVGTPLINGAKISGEIESQGRERKVVVFKFKRRKGYQKKNTHRQEYTILKVVKFDSVNKSTPAKKISTPTKKHTVDKKKSEKEVTSKTVTKKTTTKKTAVTKKSIENKKDKE